MQKKIKLFLPIFGVIALLFHPALGMYVEGLSTKAFLSAVGFNIGFFIASTALFYSMWFWRFNTVKDEEKDLVRGAPALLGYFALFLGIPASMVFSVISYFVMHSASPEISFGPGMFGAATAGLILSYRLPKVKK